LADDDHDRLGLISQEAGERIGDRAVAVHEPLVEIGKAKETMEFFDGGLSGPVLDGFTEVFQCSWDEDSGI